VHVSLFLEKFVDKSWKVEDAKLIMASFLGPNFPFDHGKISYRTCIIFPWKICEEKSRKAKFSNCLRVVLRAHVKYAINGNN